VIRDHDAGEHACEKTSGASRRYENSKTGFFLFENISQSRETTEREKQAGAMKRTKRGLLSMKRAQLGAVYVVARTAFLSRDENTRVSEVAEESRRIQASKRQ
jgi:hypothetical protein